MLLFHKSYLLLRVAGTSEEFEGSDKNLILIPYDLHFSDFYVVCFKSLQTPIYYKSTPPLNDNVCNSALADVPLPTIQQQMINLLLSCRLVVQLFPRRWRCMFAFSCICNGLLFQFRFVDPFLTFLHHFFPCI